MKKISTFRLWYTTIIVSMLLVLYSCKKSGDDGNSTPAPVSSFTWTYNGNTYVANLDTAYQFSIALSPYAIIAVNGTSFTSFTRKIMFKLSSFNMGAFTIGSGGNSLSYVDDSGNDLFGTSGTLTITSNVSNRLTGNFSCTMTGSPGTFTVTGQFANVSIRP